MAEWKRIFRNRRLCVGLLLILVLNGFLFVREQVSQNYGLDCEVSATILTYSTDGSFELAQDTVDSRAALSAYLTWVEKYQDLPIADAIAKLETEQERLTDILAIADLLEDDSGLLVADELEQYRQEQPEVVEQLEAGEINLDDVRLDYVAVNNLLSQAEYLNSYGDYLASIQTNKDSMLSFSIFNDTDSFSGRNIIKTAEEFEALTGVTLTLGSDGAVTSFLEFTVTDYLLLAVIVLVCVAFLDERKKGLWSIVHATTNGRLRLALQRTGILFGVSVVSIFLLYGTNLALGFSIYGGLEGLGRAAQSAECLGKMPLVCSIGGFLLRYFAFKVGASFLVALLLWLLFTAINNVKYTLIVAAGVLAVEYSLYTFLPVQSGWNVFKYFNIFTYISLSDLYTNYLNIDLAGFPVGIRNVSQLACVPLIFLLAAVCIVVHCHKKPAAGKDLLGRFAYMINRMADWFLRKLHLFGMELYKTLIIQKGVFIIALFLYLVLGLSFTVTVPVSTSADAAARQYTAELAGEITDDTLQRIDEVQAELDETIAACEEAKTQYENGEMEYAQYDVYVRETETAQTKAEGLDTVRKRVDELRSLGNEKGFTPWLIEESPYQGTYGEYARTNQQSAALVAILTVALLLAGSFAYEAQSGMKQMLAATLWGRKALLRRKIGLAAVIVTGVWAVTYGLEFSTFLGVCDTDTFAASVQNLSMLEDFPIVCSIGVFLIGLYLLRWLSLFAAAMLTMLISSFIKRLEISYVAVCAVTLLPSVLYLYMGLVPFKYLSLALPTEATPLLTENNGKSPATAAVCMLLAVLIGICFYILRIKMRKDKIPHSS